MRNGSRPPAVSATHRVRGRSFTDSRNTAAIAVRARSADSFREPGYPAGPADSLGSREHLEQARCKPSRRLLFRTESSLCDGPRKLGISSDVPRGTRADGLTRDTPPNTHAAH